MECLDKYLEAISHVNNTNMFSLELTENIELQGKSSSGSLYYPESQNSSCFKQSFFPPWLLILLVMTSLLLVMNVEALLR